MPVNLRALDAAGVLAFQRMAGNAAVTSVIQRDPVKDADDPDPDAYLDHAIAPGTKLRRVLEPSGELSYVVKGTGRRFTFDAAKGTYYTLPTEHATGYKVEAADLAPGAEATALVPDATEPMTIDAGGTSGERKAEAPPTEAPVSRGLKRKRPAEEDTFSDFEDEGDDEVLTPEEKMREVMGLGQEKREKFKKRKLTRTGSGSVLGSHPHDRKGLAIIRSGGKNEFSPLTSSEKVRIEGNRYRQMEGTGYFINPGGDRRSTTRVTEAPGDYKSLFPHMLANGEDPVLAPLYQHVTGKPYAGTGKLIAEHDLAKLLLNFETGDVSALHTVLKKAAPTVDLDASQLLADMSKYVSITNNAEVARSMEAMLAGSPAPYDATILIKQILTRIAQGGLTFQKAFYAGKGGTDSVFLGAPSKDDVPTGAKGGAELLRNPLDKANKKALERQMGIFPNTRKEFRAAVNALKVGAKSEFPMITEDDERKLAEDARALQVKDAAAFRGSVSRIKLPPDKYLLDFRTSRRKIANGYKTMSAWTGEHKTLVTRCEGNSKALILLEEARKDLMTL